ncbi:MAG: hypothetical protein RL417_1591, partial [Pseudomonadota bacterium]
DDEFDDSPDGDDDGEGSEDGNSGNSGSGNSGSGSGGGSEREIRGVISAIGGNEVVVGGVRFVTNSSTEYRDENGAAVTVAYFSVGMEVKARGREIGGTLSLERLESEED